MADPYTDTITAYNGSIGSLYANLKKTLQESAAAGVTRDQGFADNLNTSLTAAQNDTNSIFQADQDRLGSLARTLQAPEMNKASADLQAMRDRIQGFANITKGAATDRQKYVGGIQSDYLNRLGDSSDQAGTMVQATLISNIGKIKAEADAKAALAAAQAAAARRSSGGGGGRRSSSGGGGSTVTSSQTQTQSDASKTTERSTIQKAYEALSPAAASARNEYRNKYGDGWMQHAFADNTQNQQVVDQARDRLAETRSQPYSGSSLGILFGAGAPDAITGTSGISQQLKAMQIYKELEQLANAADPDINPQQITTSNKTMGETVKEAQKKANLYTGIDAG